MIMGALDYFKCPERQTNGGAEEGGELGRSNGQEREKPKLIIKSHEEDNKEDKKGKEYTKHLQHEPTIRGYRAQVTQ